MYTHYRKLADLHTHLYGCIHSADFLNFLQNREVDWTAYQSNYQRVIGLGLVALLGGTDSVGMTMRQALVQLTAPDNMLGRASSAHSFSAMGANHLGQMEVSFVGGIIGAGPVMVLGGAISVVVVGVIWWFAPGIRNYRYRPLRRPRG